MEQTTPQQPLPYCVPCPTPPASAPRNLVMDVVLGVAVGFAVQSLLRLWFDNRRK